MATKKKKQTSADRRELFCVEYVKTMNATQSAINAGYSPKTAKQQGSRLLTRVDVLSRVRELQQELLDKLPISVYWVLEQYIEIYNRCMQKHPVLEWSYDDKKYVETGEWAFDAKGAQSALDSIGKYLGMQVNKHEVNGSFDTKNDPLSQILNQLQTDVSEEPENDKEAT